MKIAGGYPSHLRPVSCFAGANPCTCYSCFWGGQYNRWAPVSGVYQRHSVGIDMQLCHGMFECNRLTMPTAATGCYLQVQRLQRWRSGRHRLRCAADAGLISWPALVDALPGRQRVQHTHHCALFSQCLDGLLLQGLRREATSSSKARCRAAKASAHAAGTTDTPVRWLACSCCCNAVNSLGSLAALCGLSTVTSASDCALRAPGTTGLLTETDRH
jgi:hypothetical protein